MGFEVTRIGMATGNAYLIMGTHIALVDTRSPSGWRMLLRGLEKADVGVGDIEYILITHGHVDHAGNVARIKELSGATVIAGELDAPLVERTQPQWQGPGLNRMGRVLDRLPKALVEGYQKFGSAPVERKVRDGDVIEELGLEVVATPGHTRGGVTFWDREGKRAFIGDMMSYMLNRPGMPALSASHSLEDILISQDKLASLGLETAYPGHGQIIRPEASRIIGDYASKMRVKLMCG